MDFNYADLVLIALVVFMATAGILLFIFGSYLKTLKTDKGLILYNVLPNRLVEHLPFLSRDEDIATILRIYKNNRVDIKFKTALEKAIVDKETFFCPLEIQDLHIKIFQQNKSKDEQEIHYIQHHKY